MRDVEDRFMREAEAAAEEAMVPHDMWFDGLYTVIEYAPGLTRMHAIGPAALRRDLWAPCDEKCRHDRRVDA